MTSSCKNESFQKIPPSDLLYDNSSKVWIVKSDVVEGKNSASINRANKYCYTFYRDQTVFVNKLIDFGKSRYQSGHFYFVNEGNSVLFKWKNNENIEFKIREISADVLILENENRTITLVPLDKPIP